MRSVKKNQKRLIVLSATLFMICGVALGYAALSSSIKINGTGTIPPTGTFYSRILKRNVVTMP